MLKFAPVRALIESSIVRLSLLKSLSLSLYKELLITSRILESNPNPNSTSDSLLL